MKIETETGDERFESIPWDALVSDDGDRRRRWVTLGAAALVTAAVAAAVARAVGGAPAPPVTTLAAAAPPPSTAITTPAPRSEAELSAAASSAEVSGYAAVFVADFFTADGTDLPMSSVAGQLPDSAPLPEAPDGSRSFVESAVPVAVEALGDGRHRVTVVVRSLGAAAGEEYVRRPAFAVDVVVDAGPGGPTIVDLPTPAPLPETTQAPAIAMTDDAPPPEILAAARERAGLWGEAGREPIVAGRVGDRWRVVVVVSDGAGGSWPVAVWLDDTGGIVPAGG
jgi:hypothetical protein